MPSELRKAHFCRAPFEKIEISATGDVHLCCPGWIRGPVGNLGKQTLAEIWDGEKAREMRASVRDGTFSQCSSQTCPHLQALDAGAMLPAYSPIESYKQPTSEHARKLGEGIVPAGPAEVNSAFDLTCNLSCPSCRRELMVWRPGMPQFQVAEKMANEIISALPRIRRLKLAGNGDPFASRLYWKILTSIDRELHPNLRVILHTNGLLFTAERWKEIKKAHGLIDTVEVSIDAADGGTYALNRRGGSFETLLGRLQYIAELRKQNSIRKLLISFVVQANNFREMPAFVELGRSLNADTIIFSRITDWGTFPPSIFTGRSVHLSDHPLHAEFVDVISAPVFAEKDVFLGNLNEFRKSQTASSPVL